ncbi:MAG: ABC transporter ATP-binding protein [Bacteroidota bacterium]
MKNIGKILRYLIPYWKKATMNVLFNLLSVVFGLFSVAMAIPFLGIIFGNNAPVDKPSGFELTLESLLDNFQYFLSDIKEKNGAETALLIVGGAVIVMTLFKTLFTYIAMYNLAPIRNGVPRDLRNKLFGKILRLPISYFSNERKGDIMSRMTTDVQEIEWSLVSSIEMIIRDPLTILIYLSALFYLSFNLTLFVIILLPVSGYMIGRIGKSLRKTSMKGQRRIGTLMSIMDETIGGLRIIKAFNAENKIKQRFESVNNFYTRLMIKMFRRRYLASPLSEFLGTILIVVIMWYGGTLVLGGVSELTSEKLIAYLLMFYMIIPPAKSFSTAYYNIQKGMASADRINEVLDAEETIVEKENAVSLEGFKDSIEYRNVSFKYQENMVLKNINLTIKKGMTVALVGQSGAGKTTMADLLPRFYDVTEGSVLIDGIDIRDIKMNDLRKQMGIVTQEAILFNENFHNNIAFGNDDIPESEVIAAAKVANAHDFIMETTRGYHTNIGDRGIKMSGGQRQRVSIARAVLKNPPIMILDEATSSLDTESEKLVQDALYKLMENRTSIVIAHRLSTVVDADLICVMHEGKIVETGKHNELMKLNGYYKKLNDLQIFS